MHASIFAMAMHIIKLQYHAYKLSMHCRVLIFNWSPKVFYLLEYLMTAILECLALTVVDVCCPVKWLIFYNPVYLFYMILTTTVICPCVMFVFYDGRASCNSVGLMSYHTHTHNTHTHTTHIYLYIWNKKNKIFSYLSDAVHNISWISRWC